MCTTDGLIWKDVVLMYGCMHMYMYMFYVYVYVYVYVCLFMYMYVHLCICMCVGVYVCICIFCMCVYMYVYVSFKFNENVYYSINSIVWASVYNMLCISQSPQKGMTSPLKHKKTKSYFSYLQKSKVKTIN